MVKRALVLSGGGSLGAFQCGVFKYLSEVGHQYDIVCGVSVGAINAAFISQFHKSFEEETAIKLIDMWLKINNDNVKKTWYWNFLNYIGLVWKKSFYDNEPLKNLLKNNISVQAIKDSGRLTSVGATCLDDGVYIPFTPDDENFLKAIAGSCAFPCGLPPEVIDGKEYVDGGVKSNTPLQEAIDFGANVIDAIVCTPYRTSAPYVKGNIANVGLRVLDLMCDRIVETDIKMAILYNKLVLSGAETDKKLIELNVFRPDDNLPGGGLDFQHDNVVKLIDIGYETAKAKIKI